VGLQRHSSTGQVLSIARLLAESYVSLDRNRKDIMRYKSKHNLLRWFIEDQRTLPASYVKSCQKFFKEISSKLQASSDKLTQRQTKNNE
jgi:hypothetical protein